MLKKKVLLDASAYIAYINKEPGHETIEPIIGFSCINMVTYTEIISFYTKKGLRKDLLEKMCDYVEIISLNEDICFNAGYMIKDSQSYGLSLGDRLCLSSAQSDNLAVYTADKAWLNLTEKLNIEIIAIR